MNTSLNLVEICKFREDIDQNEQELLAVDEKNVVIALHAMSCVPVLAKSDGTRVVVSFLKKEASEIHEKIVKSLGGMPQDGLMIDFNRWILGEMLWKSLLTLMRQLKTKRQPAY